METVRSTCLKCSSVPRHAFLKQGHVRNLINTELQSGSSRKYFWTWSHPCSYFQCKFQRVKVMLLARMLTLNSSIVFSRSFNKLTSNFCYGSKTLNFVVLDSLHHKIRSGTLNLFKFTIFKDVATKICLLYTYIQIYIIYK